MAIPATIRAGDSVAWVQPAGVDLSGDPLTSSSWTLTTYLRFNLASEASTVTGTARSDGGWDNAISASTSAGFDAGTWYWQTVASSGATKITLGGGTLTVVPSLAYSAPASAFDGRSQAEKDLTEVQAAIRAIISKGAKAYTIGTRSFTYADLGQLMEREAQLKAIVARERAAEKVSAGLGHPHNLFVRFGR